LWYNECGEIGEGDVAMKLTMTGQMRMEQQMKLAPRMIQSMEILQLPLPALQEKIEQELNDNPVLELTDAEPPAEQQPTQEKDDDIVEDEQALMVNQDSNKAEDFERLDNLDYDFQDYMGLAGPFHRRAHTSESDKKFEAMQNTAALPRSLHEDLSEQWRLIEAEQPVKKAGSLIIDYLDERGYLTVRLEQLHNKDKNDFTLEHLRQALALIQRLEPAGVGARDLRECLLIQMAQSDEDMSFESRVVAEHFDELLENHLPEIAKKMDCSIDRIYQAITTLSKLDTSPGLQIGRNYNRPITADVIIEAVKDGRYVVRLTDARLPTLKVSDFYMKMARDHKLDEKTKDFLQNNIRSAQWLMDAIEQRKKTLLKVTQAIVRYQNEFFEKGRLYLKPLPMSKVADDIGVHVATVSRAVAGKYAQCPQGVVPLRGFFTGGTEAKDGSLHSWDAIRAKLQQIVDNEDKTKPLSDEQIRKKLEESATKKIARRTVAKYRKLLNIPAARFRKKY